MRGDSIGNSVLDIFPVSALAISADRTVLFFGEDRRAVRIAHGKRGEVVGRRDDRDADTYCRSRFERAA
jgi:hypothetical protein